METITSLEERLRAKEKIYYDQIDASPERRKLKKEILELEKRIAIEKLKVNRECEKKGKPRLFKIDEKPSSKAELDDADPESAVCTIL